MRIKYKPHVPPLFCVFNMPVRTLCLITAGIFLSSFYLLGFLLVKNDLPYKTGVVDKIHILQKSEGWEANFTLEGDSTNVYWQNYTTNYIISALFPPIFRINDYIIHKGDTIKFAIDGSKKGYLIVRRLPTPFVVSTENTDVIYTEGLTVNGEEVASPLVVSFTRSSVDLVGTLGGIFAAIWLVLFSLDACLWYDMKLTDKKVKKHFSQRNIFIW